MKLVLKRSKRKIIAVITVFFSFQPRLVESNCELTRPKFEVKLRFYGNGWGDLPITLWHPMTHLSVFVCRPASSTVRHFLSSIYCSRNLPAFAVCIILSYYSLWNLKIHQYTQLSLKIF